VGKPKSKIETTQNTEEKEPNTPDLQSQKSSIVSTQNQPPISLAKSHTHPPTDCENNPNPNHNQNSHTYYLSHSILSGEGRK
jgi:hypothetical protein